LTIRNLTIEKLPDLRALNKLKVLRIDNCQSLKEFPDYLSSLNKLSLRSCVSAENLKSMIDNQKDLQSLYVINMDLDDDFKRLLNEKYSTVKISGKSAYANSEIQEVVDGF